MRIRIPIHPAFLEEGTDITETEEKTTKKVTKKMKQYSLILNFMAEGVIKGIGFVGQTC